MNTPKCKHIWIGETPRLLKQTGLRRVLLYTMTCPKCGRTKHVPRIYERLRKTTVTITHIT